jgi:peptide/nickel transport system ATP-binding protein
MTVPAALPIRRKSSVAPVDPTQPLLIVRDLEVEYRTRRGIVKAVDNVSFDIYQNEVFGLAGESGCGKTTIANAITRLLKPPAYISGGDVRMGDVDIMKLNEENLRGFRWEHLAIVFQSAMNSLNPVITIGAQIIDAIRAHIPMSQQEARERALELLNTVGIEGRRIDSYPHQLSGGMRQRAVIAIALALNPELIIMDEPTTALDVVVQKQIMQEIRQLNSSLASRFCLSRMICRCWWNFQTVSALCMPVNWSKSRLPNRFFKTRSTLTPTA